ncbi:hypothetical protein ACLOJK_032115 [Asimina triloba]
MGVKGTQQHSLNGFAEAQGIQRLHLPATARISYGQELFGFSRPAAFASRFRQPARPTLRFLRYCPNKA